MSNVTNQASPVDDRRKEAFANLHGSLVEYQQRFFSIGLSGTGFALVVIGWLVTSAQARAVLTTSGAVRIAGAIIMGFAGLAYVALSLRMLHVMRMLRTNMDQLAYFPSEYYAFRILQPWAAVAFMSLNAAASVIAVILMFVVPKLPPL